MLFWSLSLAIVGALFMVLYVVSRLTVRWLNGLYSRCIEEGKQIEFDRAIDHVTHQSWRYREVRIDGLIVGRLLESDGGTISVSGDVDIKDGEQVLIQRRLPHHPPPPFYLFGYERYLEARVVRPIEIEEIES